MDIDFAIKNSDISFICVGTPSNADGSIDLKYIKSASAEIGKSLKSTDGYHLVVAKSTIVPETTEKIIIPIIEEYSGKRAGKDFGVCMNPEFLKEGKAIEDFINPDRIVIGEFDKESGDLLLELYKDFKCPVLQVSLKTAEMIKYASNAFLAIKISFANEMGNICKKLDIDSYIVADAIDHDKRIGREFLNSGIGFGGSCFPKDVRALVHKAEEVGYRPKIKKPHWKSMKNNPLN